MPKVFHKECGKQVGWFLKDCLPDKMRASDYMRMDGTQPINGEIFNETCQFCGEKIDIHEFRKSIKSIFK